METSLEKYLTHDNTLVRKFFKLLADKKFNFFDSFNLRYGEDSLILEIRYKYAGEEYCVTIRVSYNQNDFFNFMIQAHNLKYNWRSPYIFTLKIQRVDSPDKYLDFCVDELMDLHRHLHHYNENLKEELEL